MKNNAFTQSQITTLAEILMNDSFAHQADWLRVDTDRNLTVARQVGTTLTFSREALLNALTTGDDQIYFGCTMDNALNAARYMHQFAHMAGVNLTVKKNKISLDNGSTIHFVSEKSHAAALAGNVYLDSYAWFKHPATAAKVAAAIACHKRHRLTMFTTPSRSHEAYRVWKGDALHRKSVPAIFCGDSAFCCDGFWRQSVTLETAANRGSTLMDIASIRQDFDEDDYRLMFGCAWSEAINAGEAQA